MFVTIMKNKDYNEYDDCVTLENGPLKGMIDSQKRYSFLESHNVYVWHKDKHIKSFIPGYGWARTNTYLYVQSFGNLSMAENKLIELLEFPEWTMLKYG